jgi:hypothetical protein
MAGSGARTVAIAPHVLFEEKEEGGQGNGGP